jgi:hypothetical protein
MFLRRPAVLLVCGIYLNRLGASSKPCFCGGLRQKDRGVFALAGYGM